MKRLLFSLFLAGSAFIYAGCKPTAPTPAATPASSPVTFAIPTNAQPKLQTLKLWIGPKEMEAELALSEIQEQTGMMFRTNMGANDGMLFVFPQPLQASFWMKNTILPLDAAYIGVDGTILEIHKLMPQDTNAVIAATDNIMFVLETPQDWFKSNNIPIGTVISTERGPLHKVFFSR